MSDVINLVAVGDLQLGDSPTTVGYGFYSRFRGRRLTPLFDDTRVELAAADILFGNLETTLLPPPENSAERSALQLRGEERFAADLRNEGFSVLNVANNHAVQHGDVSFHATIAAVRAAGIACCGVRGKTPWASEPVSLTVRGTTVGFLGYCLRPRQYGPDEPPYAEGNLAEICADVARLRAITDVVVVSMHWGEEFVPVPSLDEITLGHAIIDAGAAVIVGHHPHVTRPAERYKHGVIAYSLGNFMGDMIWYPPFRRGAVLRCSLESGAAGKASIRATRLGDSYAPSLSDEPRAVPLSTTELIGLNANDYAKAIAASMGRQRAAAYRAFVLNIPKTPMPILSQMVLQTFRNKLAALTSRISGRSERP